MLVVAGATGRKEGQEVGVTCLNFITGQWTPNPLDLHQAKPFNTYERPRISATEVFDADLTLSALSKGENSASAFGPI